MSAPDAGTTGATMRRRIQALRKAALRELLLFGNGQARRRVERARGVPPCSGLV